MQWFREAELRVLIHWRLYLRLAKEHVTDANRDGASTIRPRAGRAHPRRSPVGAGK